MKTSKCFVTANVIFGESREKKERNGRWIKQVEHSELNYFYFYFCENLIRLFSNHANNNAVSHFASLIKFHDPLILVHSLLSLSSPLAHLIIGKEEVYTINIHYLTFV